MNVCMYIHCTSDYDYDWCIYVILVDVFPSGWCPFTKYSSLFPIKVKGWNHKKEANIIIICTYWCLIFSNWGNQLPLSELSKLKAHTGLWFILFLIFWLNYFLLTSRHHVPRLSVELPVVSFVIGGVLQSVGPSKPLDHLNCHFFISTIY